MKTTRQLNPGSETDARLFRSMLKEYDKERPEDELELERAVKEFKEGELRVWVAEEAGKPLGFGALEEFGWLGPAWVTPEARGTGVHKLLLRVRIESGGGITSVHYNNSNSYNSLKKFGFEELESWNPNPNSHLMSYGGTFKNAEDLDDYPEEIEFSQDYHTE